MQKNVSTKAGFTLIEVLISVMIFSVVMTVALGALLAMSESDKQAEELKTVVNNLEFALDSMSRTIRTGSQYDCGGTGSAHDCTPPTTSGELGLVPQGGGHVYYKFDTSSADCGVQTTAGCIARSTDGGVTWLPMTSPDVQITNLQFMVIGSNSGSKIQPKVTILLSGTLQVSATKASLFNLQTSVTQRIYNQ